MGADGICYYEMFIILLCSCYCVFVVLLGIHYATGHLFDMKAITEAAHRVVSEDMEGVSVGQLTVWPDRCAGCYGTSHKIWCIA